MREGNIAGEMKKNFAGFVVKHHIAPPLKASLGGGETRKSILALRLLF